VKALTEAPMSLGERFRAAREQHGLSLSDVAEQIRIRSVYLAAIEEENWSAIGAPVYVRGFIRTYARFLGLDPEDSVAAFNERSGASVAPETSTGRSAAVVTPAARERGLSPLIWVASVVALALIALVVYLYFAPPKGGANVAATGAASAAPQATASAAPSAGPSSKPSPAAPLPVVAHQTLALHVTDASWVRVVVDGAVSIEGTLPAGTNKTFHGKVALVRVGNAGGVELTVDGKPIGKLGATGDVVEKSFTL